MLGVFDSGFGGLTILRKFQELLPQYDYMFLGDNARAPYGSRSFETVYAYTLQAVRRLFDLGCPLVILACNTASAKALRTIQQHDLPHINPNNRVLGIIRPTAEVINTYTKTNHVGILGTQGTINSQSYILEIQKLYPEIRVFQQPCPMLAALVEAGEISNPGTDYFVKKYYQQLLAQSPDIDAVVLGCTHYPLLIIRSIVRRATIRQSILSSKTKSSHRVLPTISPAIPKWNPASPKAAALSITPPTRRKFLTRRRKYSWGEALGAKGWNYERLLFK